MDKLINGIAKRVKEIRISRGLGQRELARKANLSSAYMSQLETGNRGDMDFRVSKLIKLSKALDVSADILLGLKLEQPSPYSVP